VINEKNLTKNLFIKIIDFKVPNLSYAVEIKTPAEPVKTMIEIAEKWGQDYLKFIVKDKKLHILIEDETDNARFPIGTITKLDRYDGDFQTLYSISNAAMPFESV
jgi:hypothetical protein